MPRGEVGVTLSEFIEQFRARVDQEAEKLRVESRRRRLMREEDIKYEDGVLTGYEQSIVILDELATSALDG